jgi:C1A family cysteine protease
MLRAILIFTLSLPVLAKNYNAMDFQPEPTGYSQIVVDSLWEQLGHSTPAPIPVREKVINPDPMPEPDVTPEPTPEPVKPDHSPLKKPDTVVFPGKKVKPKKDQPLKIDTVKNKINTVNGNTKRKDPLAKFRKGKTSGNSKIQEMLRKNRNKIRDRQAQADAKRNQSDEEESLQDLRNKGLSKLKKQVRSTYSNWQKQLKETYARWADQKKIYETKIPEYKEATFSFESAAGIGGGKSKMKKPLSKAVKEKFHIIPGALDVKMKNQGRRPTCAAFAGVRAIETILQGHGKEVDLSEQYFYWLSKPRCQSSPCSQRGSWVANAYKKSKNSPRPNIPGDNACPYKSKTVSGNETQIPLRQTCQQGIVKVKKYRSLDTIDEIYRSLNKNQPIVGGFKLSPNFYKTEGLVTLRDSYISGSTDSHAAGHALLIVGHMQLPKELHDSEGKLCFIVANSWGEGWGKGGFGCLTEKWVQNYQIPNAFMALDGVQM